MPGDLVLNSRCPNPGIAIHVDARVIDEEPVQPPKVDYGAGTHTFTREKIGTRYVLLGSPKHWLTQQSEGCWRLSSGC